MIIMRHHDKGLKKAEAAILLITLSLSLHVLIAENSVNAFIVCLTVLSALLNALCSE